MTRPFDVKQTAGRRRALITSPVILHQLSLKVKDNEEEAGTHSVEVLRSSIPSVNSPLPCVNPSQCAPSADTIIFTYLVSVE